MIRPAELSAIKAGALDLAFRRWAAPRVRVGTQMRTAVGLVEVTSVDRVALSRARKTDAVRAGYDSLAALRAALAQRPELPVYRIGLRYAGPDPRAALRDDVPDEAGVVELIAWLDRLDAAARRPWTRETLRIIDRSPAVRAPELAAELGRDTPDFKRDVRKLKERGLTESLDIGYRLAPRGEAVVDHEGPRRVRPPRPTGTSLPRIGAPASRALAAAGVSTLEEVARWQRSAVADLHGVGPLALSRLDEALAERGWAFADPG